MKCLRFLSMLLMVIGSLNWGLIGFFQYNLIEIIFGDTLVASVVYAFFGIAGLYGIALLCCCCNCGCKCGPRWEGCKKK